MAAEDGGTGKTAPKGFLDSLKALLRDEYIREKAKAWKLR